jgi:hypothetical protein
MELGVEAGCVAKEVIDPGCKTDANIRMGIPVLFGCYYYTGS